MVVRNHTRTPCASHAHPRHKNGGPGAACAAHHPPSDALEGVGGRYPPARHPIYDLPAFVTDNNRPQPFWQPPPNRLSNRFRGHLWGPFPSSAPLYRPLRPGLDGVVPVGVLARCPRAADGPVCQLWRSLTLWKAGNPPAPPPPPRPRPPHPQTHPPPS